MNRDRAIELLTGGAEARARWNRWKVRHVEYPDLSHARLEGADLAGADLKCMRVDGAKLTRANFSGADLS